MRIEIGDSADGTKKNYIFDGPLLTEEDHKRLSRVLDKVRDLMVDGEWRTLGEIHMAIACSCEASISARLRDLRKKKFGGHRVDRRSRDHGLWEYRMSGKGA